MNALIRHHLELVARSRRWLPPFLTYGLLLALGVSGGDDPLAGCAYSAGLLLPVTAWCVRAAATAEP
ncbi:ABC transporter, partial [Kitasatospora sp. NPDC059571]